MVSFLSPNLHFQEVASAFLPSYARASEAPESTKSLAIRKTSGPSWLVEGPALFMRLEIADRDAQTSIPKGRLLNRLARPLLQSMRSFGIRANYFGRDCLMCDGVRIAELAWSIDEEGTLIFEALFPKEKAVQVIVDQPGLEARVEKRLAIASGPSPFMLRKNIDEQDLVQALSLKLSKQLDVPLEAATNSLPTQISLLEKEFEAHGSIVSAKSFPLELGWVHWAFFEDQSVRIFGDLFFDRRVALQFPSFSENDWNSNRQALADAMNKVEVEGMADLAHLFS